jgi:hypothetical protein
MAALLEIVVDDATTTRKGNWEAGNKSKCRNGVVVVAAPSSCLLSLHSFMFLLLSIIS